MEENGLGRSLFLLNCLFLHRKHAWLCAKVKFQVQPLSQGLRLHPFGLGLGCRAWDYNSLHKHHWAPTKRAGWERDCKGKQSVMWELTAKLGRQTSPQINSTRQSVVCTREADIKSHMGSKERERVNVIRWGRAVCELDFLGYRGL